MVKQGNGSVPSEMPVADDSSKPIHVMDLIKQFDFLSIGLTGKIRCALTGRDLPLNTAAVHQHLNSKKLKKEREWYNADFSKYEPFVVAHKKNPKLLFCTLTRIELNRIPKEVEAHVNGKRYRNRKAEMEGLKQAQRQPLKEDSEEEDEEEDGAEFWMPTGGAEAMDEDGESDQEEDEEEEDDEEAEEGGSGGGVQRAPRREDKGQSAARNGRQKMSGKKGKADKTKRKAEGGREEGSDGGQQTRSSSGGQGAKGTAGNKKGGTKSKHREGKGAAKLAAKSPKPSPRSDDTPTVSKAVVKDAPPASPPSSSAKKGKKKAKTPKKGEGGEAPPKGKGVGVSASPVAAQPAAKRKHKVSDEPTSSGKKRKA